MTQGEAQELVAKLFAAFPFPQQEMTVAVYVEQMVKLPDRDNGLRAVNALIENSERLPTIAALRQTYKAVAARHQQAALPEPPVDRDENARNARAIAEALAGKFDLNEALARANQ